MVHIAIVSLCLLLLLRTSGWQGIISVKRALVTWQIAISHHRCCWDL